MTFLYEDWARSFGTPYISTKSTFRKHTSALLFVMDQQAYDQSRPYGRPPLRRKALLIGINYEGQKAALQGCRQGTPNLSHYP